MGVREGGLEVGENNGAAAADDDAVSSNNSRVLFTCLKRNIYRCPINPRVNGATKGYQTSIRRSSWCYRLQHETRGSDGACHDNSIVNGLLTRVT